MVGIDATLEEIENLLMNDQWGSVYAFLINNDGETIFHPLLRPSTEVRNFVFIDTGFNKCLKHIYIMHVG